MKEQSVGIIGAGAITSTIHLPVLKNIKGAKIAWIADREEKKAKSLAKAFRIKEAFTIKSGADLPQLPPCSVVLLATPLHAREPYIEYFGGVGVHILSEKPFAVDEEQHKKFQKMCNKANISIGYMRRTYSTAMAIKVAIKNGWFGKLKSIFYAEGARSTRSSEQSGTLDMSYLEGGGVLRDLGCHGIDLILFVTGAKDFDALSADIVWDDKTDRDVTAKFDIVGVNDMDSLRCPVIFELSWLTKKDNTILFEFENACIKMQISPTSPLEICQTGTPKKWTTFELNLPGASTFYQAFYLEWLIVLDSLYKEDKENILLASQGVITTRLINDIYKVGAQS